MRGRERNKELQTSMKKRHRPAASCTPPTGDVPATKDVPLEDVAVVFSQKEWGLLDEAQRRLYCEVMLEVFSLVSFRGHCHTMDGVEAYSEPGVPVGDSRVKASMKPPATQRTHLCRPCFSVLKATLHLTASQVAYFKKHVFFADASCFRANPHEQRRKDASGETPWKTDTQGAPLGTCCPCFLSGVPAAGAEAGDHPRAISRLLLHQAALGETHPPGAGQKQKAAARCRRRRRRGLCSSGDGIDESDARGKARGRSTVSPPPGRAQAAEDERADGRKVSGQSTEGSGAHAKKKRYQCGDCDKSFRYKSDFARHRRVHTGEKPYGCGECGRHFSQRTDLAAHRRVHTGERPYACGDCGRPFSQKTDLTKHRRVHTGEKPYRCGPCGKAFSKSYSLSRHQRRARCSLRRGEGGNSPGHKRRYRRRVHTGERPCGCSECRQAFRHRSDPCTHRKRAHPGEEP